MRVLPRGFSFITTLTIAYLADSRRVRYVPIDYARREGASRINALRGTYLFLLLILRTIMYFDPMRVLMPAALASLGMTLLTFAYELIVVRNPRREEPDVADDHDLPVQLRVARRPDRSAVAVAAPAKNDRGPVGGQEPQAGSEPEDRARPDVRRGKVATGEVEQRPRGRC